MATRILKDYDERRAEILAGAQKLFLEKGYEDTSVDAILKAVNIAKGTFYYYFKSKEELLDALVEQQTLQAFELLEHRVFDNQLDALSRMRVYFDISRSWKMQNKQMLKAVLRMMNKPANLLFRDKLMNRNAALAKPGLVRIIEQGNREGVFSVKYPEDTVDILFSMSNGMSGTLSRLMLEVDEHPENIDHIQRKVDVYQFAFERILGAPEGSLELMDREYLRTFLS